ncbi:cyclic AMP response element-binding protein A isoform X1 [Cloeon dipterum]|uniref:cyclic AMP response element-binding protein A isoform X1 n=1 Tax=Cloeon dipterum TaxID=197152 RepID=UPI0032201B63
MDNLGECDDYLGCFWEADSQMESVMCDFNTDGTDWPSTGAEFDMKIPGVVLHDRLMTDAALGAVPIKTEHSYSLASDGDSRSESPSMETMDDDDELLFSSATKSQKITFLDVKQEPLSRPASPGSSSDDDARSTISVGDNENPIITDFSKQECRVPTQSQSLLKQPQTIYLTTRSNVFGQQQGRVVIPKLNIKVEPGTAGFPLPPTPPSSTTSDNEGNVSPMHGSPPSPLTAGSRSIQARQSSNRLYLSGSSNSSSAASNSSQAHCRQPIQTSLISTQPKGMSGTLSLTEEEKKTLVAEGYPVPTRLPLTKAEEKSLKKIRRKIKNKISAQESRRKKKEYMDSLEKKVELLVAENADYKKRIDSLESTNISLSSQLQKLQQLINQNNVSVGSRSRATASSASHHFTRNSVK